MKACALCLDGLCSVYGSIQPRQFAATGTCPICGRPTDAHYRPFCSRRCADVDLSRWLGGGYAIPVEEDADEDGERAPPADSGERTIPVGGIDAHRRTLC